MEFTIKDWRFQQVENCLNELQFFTRGVSLINVKFDIDKNPQLQYVNGSAYFVRLPKEIEAEFKKKIKEFYPNGFQSVSILSWLTAKLEMLYSKFKVKKIELEEWGSMTIKSKTCDTYKAYIKIGDNLQEIIVFVDINANRLIIFRKYLQEHEVAEFPNDLELIFLEGETFKIVASDKRHQILFFDKYIIATEYVFNNKGELKEEVTAIRNDEIGFFFEGEIGKFLPITSGSYNILT